MIRSIGVAAVLTTAVIGLQSTGSPASSAPADPGPSLAQRAEAAVAALADRPGVARDASGQAFDVTSTTVDPDGTSHVRIDRTLDGLAVLGGDLVVHQTADAAFDGASQTLARPLDLATTPSLTAAAARTVALRPVGATRDIRNLRAADVAPRLVVDALGATPVLAWEVTTLGRHADGTPSRLATIVDARTGTVVRRIEGIHTADGSGESLYSGTVPLSIDEADGGYTLTDVAHGGGATTDMENAEDSFLCTILGTGCTNGVAFVSDDTSFGDGTTANRESAAVDAHYGGAETFEYFKDVHGRDGIFGDGTGAPSRVHYGDGYVNAFWDGEKMTYGDGDGTSFGPLVSLDVAGHEMSHGVTENTANLTYSGESGGLNEATSDIFGSMVEFYSGTASDPGDYFIGEQFDLANNEGFRRMDQPSLDGDSYDCYESGIGNADVHYSSGLGNHFFYLLAEGSGTQVIGGRTHTSPTCDGSTVTGIGRDDAAAIWFRALTTYFTSGTTYAQARTGTLSAAADLYGQGSPEYNAVAAAWSAVNVG